MRRDQSPTRANAPKLEWDAATGMWKANPLADWDDDGAGTSSASTGCRTTRSTTRGYASIGCTYCTMPGNGREGRWSATARPSADCTLSRADVS